MERRFPMIFGGYSVEVPEAHLVVNEKLPAPRFNWVQDVRCSPMRVTAFLERTLDHYYARALRPTFQIRSGQADRAVVHALGLAQYAGLGPSHRSHLLVWDPHEGEARLPPTSRDRTPTRLQDDEFGTLADLLVLPRQRQEVVRCLEVAETHPNPGERTVAYVARTPEGPRSVAIYARQGHHAGLFGVGTLPEARAQGWATDLVAGVLRAEAVRDGVPVVLSAEGARPPSPLLKMGFEFLESFDVYALTPEGDRKGF